MLEPARVATVIELITQCEESWQGANKLPADKLMHNYFRDHRFMGSKDRGAVSELVYFIIRNYAALQWWGMRSGVTGPRALAIAALMFYRGFTVTQVKEVFNGEKFSERELNVNEETFAREIRGHKFLHHEMPDDVRYNFPVWMTEQIKTSFGETWKEEILALSTEAPVDIRANTLLTTRDELLEALTKEGLDVAPTPHSPIGIRMKTRAPIFTSPQFKKGCFEMQDEGSQIVSLMLEAKPGERVIDFCAGAGGKTLAIAAEMKNKGRILAWDTSAKRLDQMPERLRRAKVDNVQRHVLESERDEFLRRHKNSADAVFVDAPCTGAGTWRRNPDLKWRATENDLNEIILLQQKIISNASRLVKVGGRLLYVTCSFLRSENEQQIESFLSQSQNFKVVTETKIWSKIFQTTLVHDGMFRLTPHKDGTDGFFAAMLQRTE